MRVFHDQVAGITLVAEHESFDIALAVVLDLTQPHIPDFVEAGTLVHIIYNYNYIGIGVVRLSDAFESLLAGCIPQLQFHIVVIDLH
jgi:hypothetical protein